MSKTYFESFNTRFRTELKMNFVKLSLDISLVVNLAYVTV